MRQFFAGYYHRGVSWFLRTLGPQSYKNLLDSIDHVMEQGDTNDIAIYPFGQYMFDVMVNNGQNKQLAFPTPQERNAFQFGMANGISIMGGSINHLSGDEAVEAERMMSMATHFPENNRDN